MGIFGRSRRELELTARVETLERGFKALEAEWNEWFDKYRRLYMRLSKRIADEEKPPTLTQDERSPAKPYQITNPLARAILGGSSDGVLPPTR